MAQISVRVDDAVKQPFDIYVFEKLGSGKNIG